MIARWPARCRSRLLGTAATEYPCSSRRCWHPFALISDQRVGADEELSHDGGEGELYGLAAAAEGLVAGLEVRVEADGDKGRHVLSFPIAKCQSNNFTSPASHYFAGLVLKLAAVMLSSRWRCPLLPEAPRCRHTAVGVAYPSAWCGFSSLSRRTRHQQQGDDPSLQGERPEFLDGVDDDLGVSGGLVAVQVAELSHCSA